MSNWEHLNRTFFFKLRNYHCFSGRIMMLQIQWVAPCLSETLNETLMDKIHLGYKLPKKFSIFFK